MINEIYDALDRFSESAYQKVIDSKFDHTDYQKWKMHFDGTVLNGLSLNHDTTPRNMCFSSFTVSKRHFDKVMIQDMFFLHKSIIGDYYCLYVKSKVIAKYDEGKIAYPQCVIISPESIYQNYFDQAHKMIVDVFPDARMIPFSILNQPVNQKIPFFTEDHINYYQALFGYEGDITRYHAIGDGWYKKS